VVPAGNNCSRAIGIRTGVARNDGIGRGDRRSIDSAAEFTRCVERNCRAVYRNAGKAAQSLDSAPGSAGSITAHGHVGQREGATVLKDAAAKGAGPIPAYRAV